jgi:hypothetical protein
MVLKKIVNSAVDDLQNLYLHDILNAGASDAYRNAKGLALTHITKKVWYQCYNY